MSDPDGPTNQARPRPDGTATSGPTRGPATIEEAKALAHPLRLQILRLCAERDRTNKQLADLLGRDPATIHYHVKQLVAVGFLAAAPARTGASGALEKPYRSTQQTWWLDNPLGQLGPDASTTLLDTFQAEVHRAGAENVRWSNRFMLHLSPDEAAELERRLLAVIDEYVSTDDQRRHHPAHGGIIALHQLAE